MLVKIADRRETLQMVEKQLQQLDRVRSTKQSQLRDLERKLVRGLLWVFVAFCARLCFFPLQCTWERIVSVVK